MAPKVAPKKAKKQILVVEDHPIVRKGLMDLINHASDLTVCGEAESAEEARRLIPIVKPDLIVADLSLRDAGDMDLLKDLRIRHPELPTLVVSMHEERIFAERALRVGAKGYIMKHEAVEDITTAIRTVLRGKIYLSASMSDQILQTVAHGDVNLKKSPMDRLSDRELEVFQLIGKGIATGEIARKLHLSVKTVETHRSHIKEKLNLKTAIQLVQYATQWAHR